MLEMEFMCVVFSCVRSVWKANDGDDELSGRHPVAVCNVVIS